MDALRAAGCVFAEDEAEILAEAAQSSRAGSGADDALAQMVARRVAGWPLEQIVGWVDFAGLRLSVKPGVFVPRQRSALLAALSVQALREYPGPHPHPGSGPHPHPGPRFLEAFCGVGPVAAVVAASVPEADIHLGESDPSALECAVSNARSHLRNAGSRRGQPLLGSAVGEVTAHRLDCLRGLPRSLRGTFDVIAAVPPYVPAPAAEFLPREALDFEPPGALFAGDDGLDLLRRLIAEAGEWLSPRGRLLIECGREQSAAAEEIAADHDCLAHSHLGEDRQTTVLDVRSRR